jgi:alpha-glucosidase (family GH31 glycosyl hydrolase)
MVMLIDFRHPSSQAMVDHLHALGFKVTVWIMPFAEEDSDAYREGGPL